VAKRFTYEVEWDTTKARDNLKKHKVAFERAATIFLDQEALSDFDEDESGDEDRWITLGLDRTGVLPGRLPYVPRRDRDKRAGSVDFCAQANQE